MTDLYRQSEILDHLYHVIDSRRMADPQTSHTARLRKKGRKKIAQKVGEEAIEVVIASLAENRTAVVRESVDLFYYLLLLWSECGVLPSTVWTEMQDRFGKAGMDRHKERLV